MLDVSLPIVILPLDNLREYTGIEIEIFGIGLLPFYSGNYPERNLGLSFYLGNYDGTIGQTVCTRQDKITTTTRPNSDSTISSCRWWTISAYHSSPIPRRERCSVSGRSVSVVARGWAVRGLSLVSNRLVNFVFLELPYLRFVKVPTSGHTALAHKQEGG